MAEAPSPAPASGCLDDLDALAFVEGTVPLDRRGEILAHLELCANCAALVGGLLAGTTADAAPVIDDGPVAPLPDTCGPYRIGALLAEGGMGRIYRAIDTALGRPVAIKVPAARSPGLRRRFRREMEITARLRHPGVVPIHAGGELPDGTPYYVMALVDGATLDRAIAAADGPTGRLALVDTLVTVADTMADVHRQGIVHRDLKPNNIVVDARGDALILDWGLAKEVGAASSLAPGHAVDGATPASEPGPSSAVRTRAGDVLGTPAFMAPEQAAGRPVDARADVHACGAILATILAGTPDVPAPARLAALAAPRPLLAVCARAMAPAPDDRYRDAGELAVALRAALATIRRRPRRRRRLIAGAALVASVGAVALVVWRTAPARHVERRLVRLAGEPSGNAAIALSPSGRRIAYATDDRIQVRDLASGQQWSQPAMVQSNTALQFDGEDVLTYARLDTAEGPWQLVTWSIASGVERERPVPPERRYETWRGTFAGGDVLASSSPPGRLALVAASGSSTGAPVSGRVASTLVAIAPGRARLAYVDDIDRTHGVIRVLAADGSVIASPLLRDVTALSWLDDDRLAYATGSRGDATLAQVKATAAGLGRPSVLLVHREPRTWIGGLVGSPGRLLVVLSTLQIETQIHDRDDGTTVSFDAIAAAAPLAWRTDERWLAWNRDSTLVEERALARGALPAVVLRQRLTDPASATLAGDLLIVAERTAAGRRVLATSLADGRVRWTSSPAALELVRCAGDASPPCVAVASQGAEVLLRTIDPATGELGAVLARARDITDVAVDARGAEVGWIDDAPRAWRAPLDGHAPPLAMAPAGSLRTLAFDPRTGELLSTRAVVGGRELVRLTAEPAQRVALTGATVVSLLRPSPDGRRILYQTRVFERTLTELLPPP